MRNRKLKFGHEIMIISCFPVLQLSRYVLAAVWLSLASVYLMWKLIIYSFVAGKMFFVDVRHLTQETRLSQAVGPRK